jgi:hypothetical protein
MSRAEQELAVCVRGARALFRTMPFCGGSRFLLRPRLLNAHALPLASVAISPAQDVHLPAHGARCISISLGPAAGHRRIIKQATEWHCVRKATARDQTREAVTANWSVSRTHSPKEHLRQSHYDLPLHSKLLIAP